MFLPEFPFPGAMSAEFVSRAKSVARRASQGSWPVCGSAICRGSIVHSSLNAHIWLSQSA